MAVSVRPSPSALGQFSRSNKEEELATSGADLPDTNPNDEPAKPDAVVSGSAYRGAVSRGDRIVWWCPHIHFAEHSARACAARRLERGDAFLGDVG